MYTCTCNKTHPYRKVNEGMLNLLQNYFLPSLDRVPLCNCLPLRTLLKFSEGLWAGGSDVYESVSSSSPKKVNLRFNCRQERNL